MAEASKPMTLTMYSARISPATRPAAAVEDMKSIIGVKDSSATATTPMPTNRANSRLRMPRMSPNTPRNGADSATMAMAMEVA